MLNLKHSAIRRAEILHETRFQLFLRRKHRRNRGFRDEKIYCESSASKVNFGFMCLFLSQRAIEAESQKFPCAFIRRGAIDGAWEFNREIESKYVNAAAVWQKHSSTNE